MLGPHVYAKSVGAEKMLDFLVTYSAPLLYTMPRENNTCQILHPVYCLMLMTNLLRQ